MRGYKKSSNGQNDFVTGCTLCTLVFQFCLGEDFFFWGGGDPRTPPPPQYQSVFRGKIGTNQRVLFSGCPHLGTPLCRVFIHFSPLPSPGLGDGEGGEALAGSW